MRNILIGPLGLILLVDSPVSSRKVKPSGPIRIFLIRALIAS